MAFQAWLRQARKKTPCGYETWPQLSAVVLPTLLCQQSPVRSILPDCSWETSHTSHPSDRTAGLGLSPLQHTCGASPAAISATSKGSCRASRPAVHTITTARRQSVGRHTRCTSISTCLRYVVVCHPSILRTGQHKDQGGKKRAGPRLERGRACLQHRNHLQAVVCPTRPP